MKNVKFEDILLRIAEEERDFKNNLVPDIEKDIMDKIDSRTRKGTRRFYYFAMAASIAFFVLITLFNNNIKSKIGYLDTMAKADESVSIINKNGRFIASNGQNRLTGDRFSIPVKIKTAGFSVLNINMMKKAVALIRPNTQVEVTEKYINILSGKVLFDFKKLKSPYYIKTEIAKIRILGTRLSVEYNKDDCKISLLRGKIEVSNDYGKIILNGGEGIELHKNTKTLKKYILGDEFIKSISNWKDPILNKYNNHDDAADIIHPKNINIPDIKEEFDKLKGTEIGH